MILGVSGAPHTGKTEVANELAKKLKYDVQTYKFDMFYDKVHLKSESVGNLIERLNVQSEIINDMCTQLNEISDDNVIFDGTPIDAFSYLVADLSSQNIYPFRRNERIAEFVHNALTGMRQEIQKVMMNKFEFLVVCQPKEIARGAYDEMNFNRDFKNHVGFITNGVLSTLPLNSIFLGGDKPDLEADVDFVLKHIDKYSSAQKEKLTMNKITVN